MGFGGLSMRVVLLLLLCASVLAGDAFAQQATCTQSYTPQTWTPQTFSPQTHAPQAHSPQGWTPQTGDTQSRPRRRTVRCTLSDEPNDFCFFSSEREFRPGSACTCGNGTRGSIN